MSATLITPFKLSEQQIADGVECSICLETDNADYTNHTNSTHAPWHVSCITDWLNKGGNCPECNTELNNTLKSSASKTFNFIKKISYGTSLGFQYAYNEQMFGLFTAVALTAFIAGMDQARDVLAVLGTSCIAAGIYGIGHRFQGSELSAESNTAKYVAPVTILTTIVAALFLRDSKPAQIAGVLAILYNAGKLSVVKGALLGALSGGGALKSLGEASTNVLRAAQVGGATGGITKARTTPLPITLFSSLSGFAIAKAAADVFIGIKNPIARAILSGAVGGMFASSTATVLDNGYASVNEQGLALFARRDS